MITFKKGDRIEILVDDANSATVNQGDKGTVLGRDVYPYANVRMDGGRTWLISDDNMKLAAEDWYRPEMLRTTTAPFRADLLKMLSNAGLGIAGEAGEVADIVKKFLHHEKPEDVTREVFDAKYRDKMIKELGDVAWYFELMCYAVGVTSEEVKRENCRKLRLRYPEGFSPEAAAAKADEKKVTE